MKKVSISDAALHFGISKEAIHNRIRRGSLEIVIENGVKMVLLDSQKVVKTTRRTTATNTSQNDERYYKLLQEQNSKLQARVDTLEDETRSLRDQKELMLIEERKKIEAIYKEKDEQLKNFLSTLSSQFMLHAPAPELEEPEEMLEAEIETPQEENNLISLKKYLKSKKFSNKKIDKIQAKFKKHANKDERVVIVGNKYYIDPSKHDYSDLI